MVRELFPGTLLEKITGSDVRWPGFKVLIWDPFKTQIGQIARGDFTEPGLDISHFVQSVELSENIGFENANDPTVPTAALSIKRHDSTGQPMRRGFFEDGVLVQVLIGDIRIREDGWIPVFTGTFRGRPGDNPGTPSNLSEGLTATAYGREERYSNMVITTDAYPAGTELGTIATDIAAKHMGLQKEEILFGALGLSTRHTTSQVVEEPALSALWHCMFPVGKKPKFDAVGRLRAVDVSLDKPAARHLKNVLVETLTAAPNDVEVNNSVVLKGLSSELEKLIQETKMLATVSFTTGYFDEQLSEPVYFSQDRTQRAEETYVVQTKRIRWSDASWTQLDEFHGVLEVDTRFLARIRTILFSTFLATTILVALLDLALQEGSIFVTILTFGTLAALRFALEILSMLTLVGFLWATTFIGRGTYEVKGKSFEFAFRELTARHQLVGLRPEEVREIEFRNDFLTTMDELSEAASDRLRREILKDQLYAIVATDDPALEVDDVVEDEEGNRYYITAITRSLAHNQPATMQLSTWKIWGAKEARVMAAVAEAEE